MIRSILPPFHRGGFHSNMGFRFSYTPSESEGVNRFALGVIQRGTKRRPSMALGKIFGSSVSSQHAEIIIEGTVFSCT